MSDLENEPSQLDGADEIGGSIPPSQEATVHPDGAGLGTTLTKPKKPVFLCVRSKKGVNDLHYAVVPLPASYQDAKETAIDVLGGYLGYPNVVPNDIYIRYGVRRGTPARTHWAYIKPAFWDNLITGGEDLLVLRKHKPNIDDRDEDVVPEQKPITISLRLGGKYSKTGNEKYARIVVPDTYEEAKRLAIECFNKYTIRPANEGNTKLMAAMNSGFGGTTVVALIPPSQWKDVVMDLKKENPNFEVMVIVF